MKTNKLIAAAVGLSTVLSINTVRAQSCSELTGAQTCRYYWEGCGVIANNTVPSTMVANCKTWEADTSSGCGCASCNSGYTLTTVNEKYGNYPGALSKRCVKSVSTDIPCTISNCTNDKYVFSNGTVYCRGSTPSSCTGIGQTGSNFALYSQYCEDGHGKYNHGICAPGTCPSGFHKSTISTSCTKDCSANYYLSNSACTPCPSYNNIAGLSATNSERITDCYIPSTSSWNFSDSTGSGTAHFKSNCYYSN